MKKYFPIFSIILTLAVLLLPFVAEANIYYDSQFGSAGSGNGQFGTLHGIAVDSSDNIFVVDGGNNRVQKFNSSGVYQSKFGTAGSGNGQFGAPMGIAIDSSDNIYVADTGNNRVQKFNSSGVYQSQFGTAGSGNGQFNSPQGIAIDSSENLYVLDFANSRVQKFNSSGVYQSQFGTAGSGNGQFNNPRSIVIDSLDNIYVTDTGNNRVQKFNSSGVYQSQFGTLGSSNGQFNYPFGITTDSLDNVYVTDYSNHRVQKFNSSAVFQAKFGTEGSGNGQFNSPFGITTDSLDNIFVAEIYDYRIQKFIYSPITISRSSVSIDEGEEFTYTVVLDTLPTDSVTVTLSASDPVAGSGVTLSSSVLTFTLDNWDTPQTVTVTSVSDESNDGNRDVNISSVLASSDLTYDGANANDVAVTINESITITNCTELQAIEDDLASSYVLANGIDCTGVDFIPIGTYDTDPFTGSLDGQGYSITNLDIDQEGNDYVGLFAYITGSTISDLTLESGSIVGDDYVGGIAGYADGDVTLDNVVSDVDITIISAGDTFNVGGLIGYANDSLAISDSHYSGDVAVTATSFVEHVGGLAGYVGSNSTVNDSYVDGDVTVSSNSAFAYVEYVGGLLGEVGNSFTLTDSHYVGNINVTARDYGQKVGGFVGYVSSGATVNNSYVEGNIVAVSENDYFYYLGGLIGYANDTFVVTDSYYAGDLNLTAETYINYIGGLFGEVGESSITNTYADGDITATSNTDYVEYLGGFIGYSNDLSSISDGYYLGDILVTAESYAQRIGGLTGNASGEAIIEDSHVEGAITVVGNTDAVDYVGGLVGQADYMLSVNNGYYVGDMTLTALYIYEIGGLAGEVNDALTLTDSYYTGNIVLTVDEDVSQVGGLAGYIGSDSTFHTSNYTGNITITATLYGLEEVGGLVGYANGAVTLFDSHYLGDLSLATEDGLEEVGGLVGYASGEATTINSYADMDIIATDNTGSVQYMGGLIGYASDSIVLTDSYYLGDMDLTAEQDVSYLGGLVGYVSDTATVSDAHATGGITAVSNDSLYSVEYIGGLVGDAESYLSVTDSHYLGDLNLTAEGYVRYIGGLNGYVSADSFIDTAYVEGNITTVSNTGRTEYIGGFVGDNDGAMTILNGYYLGDMSLTAETYIEDVGGLAGYVGYDALIDTSYTEGNITAIANTNNVNYLGGLVGRVDSSFFLSDSHYLGDLSLTAETDLQYLGGLVGNVSENFDIETSYVDSDITLVSNTDSIYYLGGFLGYHNGNSFSIADSYYLGDFDLTAEIYIEDLGGFVGYVNGSGSITDSYAEGDTTAISNAESISYFGGLLGDVSGSIVNILNSHYIGDINLTSENDLENVGGLMGYSNTVSLENSYVEGNITVTSNTLNVDRISGLFGDANTIDMVFSYYAGDITVTSGYYVLEIGGLAGYASSGGSFDRSYALGSLTINAVSYVEDGIGGLVGYANDPISITDSFANMDIIVNSDDYISSVGGLVGDNDGYPITVNTSYASGALTLDAGTYIEYVGGLIGYNDATHSVLNSFSAKDISLTSGTDSITYAGGILGNNDVDSFLNNYYDEYLSDPYICNGDDDPDPSGCAGVNTANATPNYFKNNSTNAPFTAWDFSTIWDTNTNYYPTLQNPALNVITTQSASNIDRADATLNARLNVVGISGVTNRGFYYGLTEAYGETISESGSFDTGNYSLDASGLLCNNTYHFKAFTTTSQGIFSGADGSFTTARCSRGGGGGGGGPSRPIVPTTPTDCLPGYLFSPSTGQSCPSSVSLASSSTTSNSVVPNLSKTLKPGMTDPEVKLLQQYLNTHGFPVSLIGPGSLGNETTLFGPKTKAAVILFQKANSLTPDGIVGPMTRGKMK